MQPASARWDNTSAIILLQHFCLGMFTLKKKSPPLFCFLLSKQSCFFNYENGFKVGTVKVKNMF